MLHTSCELAPAGPEIGLGVFATEPIPRGTIVWVLDELDQYFDPARFAALRRPTQRLLERYAYRDGSGGWILCWDLARWVNHSCDANVRSTGWNLDIAVRDIAPGEEITNDYGVLNLERSLACRCGAEGCRGTIRPGDFERIAAHNDALVREAFPDVVRVHQPLWDWVGDKRAVRAAARQPALVPSVLAHRMAGPGLQIARAGEKVGV